MLIQNPTSAPRVVTAEAAANVYMTMAQWWLFTDAPVDLMLDPVAALAADEVRFEKLAREQGWDTVQVDEETAFPLSLLMSFDG